MPNYVEKTVTGDVVQVTTWNERFYRHPKSGLFYPSVTWIAGYYPKGAEWAKWLAKNGWDEAQAILHEAGNHGTKVHKGIEHILGGGAVGINDTLVHPETGREEPITLEEYEALMSFVDWFNEYKPETLGVEEPIFYDDPKEKDMKWAGTRDYRCKIGKDTWTIDFKTSRYLWPSHKIQLSAYGILNPGDKLAVLQVGYPRNKKRFKMTIVDPQYGLFVAAHRIWRNENPRTKLFQKEYPRVLTINPKPQPMGELING